MYGLPPQTLRFMLMRTVSTIALMNAIPSLAADPSK